MIVKVSLGSLYNVTIVLSISMILLHSACNSIR